MMYASPEAPSSLHRCDGKAPPNAHPCVILFLYHFSGFDTFGLMCPSSSSGCNMPRDHGCVHVHVWVTGQQHLYLMLDCCHRCHVLPVVRDALPYCLPSGDLYSDSVGSPLDVVAGGVCYSCRLTNMPRAWLTLGLQFGELSQREVLME